MIMQPAPAPSEDLDPSKKWVHIFVFSEIEG